MSDETTVTPTRFNYSRQVENLKLAMNLIDQALHLMDDVGEEIGRGQPLWQRVLIWFARRRYNTLRRYARDVKRVLPRAIQMLEA